MAKPTRTKLWRRAEGKKRGIKQLPPLPKIDVKLSNGGVITVAKGEAYNVSRRLRKGHVKYES